MNLRKRLRRLVNPPVSVRSVPGVAGSGARHVPAGGPWSRDRDYWVHVLERIASPVVGNLAAGTLRASMPVEQSGRHDRQGVAHLEAFGRTLAGIAPWLELEPDDTAEGRLRAEFRDLVRRALINAVDPSSRDSLKFADAVLKQPLVDAAYLAQALVRAPRALTAALDAQTRAHLVTAFETTRVIQPNLSNWLLFPAMVEAGLAVLGARWDPLRVEYGLRQHDQWYAGDGAYGDGPEFHWDYYNSYVMHPMMIDVIDTCRSHLSIAEQMAARVDRRARRYAAVLERLVAPDGTFPPIGRSITYRVGAFQLLSQMALRRSLPDGVSAAQVRSALTAAMHRSLDAPGTFDANGWLQIGLCGHQPATAENYITTGSLYMCALVLLPLGLGPDDPFWSLPGEAWTSARAWSGQPFPADHALSEETR
ncbi:MAG: DUF2264 domain-containing protein [Acidobacteria bacterium]|nr:DUF2264 domain-containing protein [Acidobacteriota bacterium]